MTPKNGLIALALGLIAATAARGSPADSEATDPTYLELFPGRSQVVQKGKPYWVFKVPELGKQLGCYRWGCKLPPDVLIGKTVVVTGMIAMGNLGGRTPTAHLEFLLDTNYLSMLKGPILEGAPPPLVSLFRIPQSILSEQVKKAGCENPEISPCRVVVWGEIRSSQSELEVPGLWAKSKYAYIDAAGINIFDAYTISQASIENLKIGLDASVGLILKAGFSLIKLAPN